MPRPRVAMRRIKEVLRLKVGLGLSGTAVSRSVRIARSTVKEYLDRAAAAGLNWETAAELSEEDLDHRLFAAADTPSGSSVAGLGSGREGAARPRRDAAVAVAGISEPPSGRLPLHPVLHAFPRLAATLQAADDAPAASRRRRVRSRFGRPDAEHHR